ncbi:MAG TPA: polyprenyl synthetase family protein [Bacteroidota bacterium]|nr:polyprenyl synthetase family protein [Bacteroidota bacterium]
MNDDSLARYADTLRSMIDRRTRALAWKGKSSTLRAACAHVLEGGGKRIRGMLVLLSCRSVGGTVRRSLDAAVAIEAMHDFTLVHDDIMDNADSRRGRPTVHKRWNANTAILAGDVLLGLAYRSLLGCPGDRRGRLVDVFTEGLIDVCDGQGMDMELARRTDVSLAEYFAMIEKKTGALIATSAEMGGLIGGGTPAEVRALRKFGHYLGRAFQLQDDLLDVVADEKQLGKPIGGDIVEGKKTFLLISAAGRAQGADKELIDRVLRREVQRDVVGAVTDLFQRYGILEDAERRILHDTRTASRALDALRPSRPVAVLRWLAGALVHRAS